MRFSLSVRSKDHFTRPRWSYSVICENASQKTPTIFLIKMCIFFIKNVLQFCKFPKIRVKGNLFKSKEGEKSEVIKRRLKCS